jgi:hypothetical protein
LEGRIKVVKEKILRLVQLYKQQLVLFQEMHSFAESQHRLCNEADFNREGSLDALYALFLKRQAKISLIAEIEEKIVNIYQSLQQKLSLTEVDMGSLSKYYSAPEVLELQSIGKSIGVLLKDISALDNQLRSFFEEKLTLFQQKITRVQREKGLLRTYYHGYQQKEGIFLDHSK